jgi:hypothetical protein
MTILAYKRQQLLNEMGKMLSQPSFIQGAFDIRKRQIELLDEVTEAVDTEDEDGKPIPVKVKGITIIKNGLKVVI